MMLYVYIYGHLLLAVWIGLLKVQSLEDIPIVNKNTGDITDETTHNANSMDINGAEVEDVYDEYMKVIIYNGLQILTLRTFDDETVLIRATNKFRNAVENKQKIWDDGIVPYVISDEYSKDNKDLILESVEEFHNKTCVQFQQRKNETSYILLEPGSGCSAVVGKLPNNANRVTLHENCFVKGIVLHELMHALGFVHEQNRPDRDEFVTIDFDNIRNGSVINFNKYSENELHMFNQTYDYESVMHYGPHDFAENKSKPTIVPIKKGVKIGQRKGFSEKDLIKINLLYNCTGAAAVEEENKTEEMI